VSGNRFSVRGGSRLSAGEAASISKWAACGRGRARWQLTPEGNGACLTTTFDYALPGGVFGKVPDALVVKGINNAKSLEEAPRNFKALVEAQ
jgi:hypothetical protein